MEKLRNKDGKNPLEIAREMKGLSTEKERSISFMCFEMTKKTETKMMKKEIKKKDHLQHL